MTKKEREERIKELESRRFFLAMKDRWTEKDYERDEELREEIRRLENAQ